MRRSKYWYAGVTVFLTVAAILLFYDTLFGSRSAVILLMKLFHAIEPILYGAMMAYLLAPVVDISERKLFRARIEAAGTQGKFCARGPRAVSILITWVVIAILLYLLLSVLLPEVYRSVVQLFGNMESYYNTITEWIVHFLDQSPDLEVWVMDQLSAYYKDLSKMVTDQLLPQARQLMSAVSGGVAFTVGFFKNLLVGIIVSIYLLATKERCAAHCRKLLCGCFPPVQTKWIFRGIAKADGIFSGFVRGKLLDSLIIGVLCFFFSSLFNFPYAPLVSVIIGVTNVIPFFGPFLGAVPSLFLILLDSPIKALYFLIFIIALQQVDGNIIGPKILGDRTGLSSLWVIIAILVGGSFFGVPGMFFGVPVFACFNTLVEFLVDVRLKKQGYPRETSAYHTVPPEVGAATPPEERRGSPPPKK